LPIADSPETSNAAAITFSAEDRVGFVTINHPPLNLITFDMVYAFEDVLEEAQSSGIRALVMRSEGPHFSAGAYVGTFKGVDAAEARRVFARGLPMLHRLESLPFPTIAAVNGMCLAAGLELALGCDLIIAEESAQFAQVEILIGTTTLLGGIQRLAERAGPARAREVVFSGQMYTAAMFERWNIVNTVVPDGAAQDAAQELARRYASGPTRGYAAGKRLVRAFLDGGVQAADAALLDVAPALFETADMRAGIDTVLDKGAKAVGTTTFVGG
jgi:enoyl-CoA hydratase/carnithine racemase